MGIKGFSPRKVHHIGLDIGSYAVKIVNMLREKEKRILLGYGMATIETPEDDASIRKAVEAALSKLNVDTKDVAISVSGPGVIVRYVELPRMTDDELKNAIEFEAEKYIPFKLDEVMIDHQVLIRQMPDNKMLVLLVAAKKELVDKKVALVQSLGFTPTIIDVCSLAMVNSFLEGNKGAEAKTSALINVGHHFTDINIISGGTLSFTRSVNVGGSDLAKMAVEAMGGDTAEAMRLMLSPGEKGEDFVAAIRRGMDNITDEIRLSMSYFENQSNSGIQEMYITGGCARLKPLLHRIKESLGIEPVVWDPTALLEPVEGISGEDLSSAKEFLGISIGLALRN